jgi:hypothetical protein
MKAYRSLLRPTRTRASVEGGQEDETAHILPKHMLRLAEDTVDGVDIRSLQPGTTVVVETYESCYRFVILFDPSAVLVKGGKMFRDHTVVRLVGASVGRTTLKGWIVVGLRIEMVFGSACIRSSLVRSVKVENVLPSIWHAFRPDVLN